MSELDILRYSAAGMSAERSALDLAARNVAAAQATGAEGSFTRLVPVFSSPAPDLDGAAPDELSGDGDDDFPVADDAGGDEVRYAGARAVRGADVDAVTEMVAVLDAQRAYETNASVFDTGKRLAERTIDLGRL